MRKAIWTIVLILFFAATLCACSSNKFPTGKYTRGDTTLEFRDDRTFSLMSGDEVVTEGTYSIQDDEIQFMDRYCDDLNAGSATYQWQHDEDKDILSFELIGDDLCEDRQMTFSVNWFGPK